MVAPELSLDRGRPPRLPARGWSELAPLRPLPDGARDPDLPRLLQRHGSIVPLGPLVQFTGERALDTLELSVCLDERGEAEGLLYEDAGDGWGFERGEYRVTRLTARRVGGALEVMAEAVEGQWPHAPRPIRAWIAEEGDPLTTGRGRTRGRR
jgi:alpha-glucosidase